MDSLSFDEHVRHFKASEAETFYRYCQNIAHLANVELKTARIQREHDAEVRDCVAITSMEIVAYLSATCACNAARSRSAEVTICFQGGLVRLSGDDLISSADLAQLYFGETQEIVAGCVTYQCDERCQMTMRATKNDDFSISFTFHSVAHKRYLAMIAEVRDWCTSQDYSINEGRFEPNKQSALISVDYTTAMME